MTDPFMTLLIIIDYRFVFCFYFYICGTSTSHRTLMYKWWSFWHSSFAYWTEIHTPVSLSLCVCLQIPQGTSNRALKLNQCLQIMSLYGQRLIKWWYPNRIKSRCDVNSKFTSISSCSCCCVSVLSFKGIHLAFRSHEWRCLSLPRAVLHQNKLQ